MQILLRSLLVILAYWGTAKLGMAVPYIGTQITLFWLPAGVAVAALLRYGWSCILAIALGALLIDRSVNEMPLLAVTVAAGNILAPVVCASLLNRWGFRPSFERRRDSFLLCGAAALGMLLSSVPGIFGMYWQDSLSVNTWSLAALIWWLGDILGVLLVCPLLLSLTAPNVLLIRQQSFEFIGWLLSAVAVGAWVFPLNQVGSGVQSLPLAFLPLPLVVWAALRFGLLGASLSALWFAGLAVWSAHSGAGPFALPVKEHAQLLIMTYCATLSSLALTITAVHGNINRTAAELRDSAARYRQMFDANPHAMWVYDLDTLKFLAVNEAATRHYGYSRDEFCRMTIMDIRVPEDVSVLLDMLADLRGGGDSSSVCRHRTRSGQIILAEISSHALTFNDHKARVVLITDITDRMRAESRLRHSEMLLKEAQHVAQLGCWEINLPDGDSMLSDEIYRVCDKPAGSLAQFPDELLQQLHPDDQSVVRGFFQSALTMGQPFDQECRLLLPDNRIRWLNIRSTTHLGHDGKPVRLVGTLQDISSRKDAEMQIHQLAFFDLLTLLPNRRLLIDRLHQTQTLASRSGQYGSLLFIDLDHFKTLNDSQGHDAGDELLIQVAERLQSCIRESDTAARLGGDEFVVMLVELGTEEQSAMNHTRVVAEKIREVIAQPCRLKGGEYTTTPSIGISLFRGHEQSIDDLLKQADVAMYQAKAEGRNTIIFFDPAMQATLEARLSLEVELRRALPLNQLIPYFQLQIDATGKVLGAEVLLRWVHPLRGMVSPAQFIPLAEETGLIIPIGEMVLEAACDQLKRWEKNEHTCDLLLAVNVSAKQFHQANFVEQVSNILTRTAVNPRRLKLELTESLVLDNVENVIGKMHALRSLGVGFSMDDFGTGHSSLTYLKRLPLDQLKIDQTFVRDIATDPNDAVIVQTIIAMARALGLHVIAEGVETDGQLSFLQQHGCEAFQGYFFSRPVPLAEFEKLVLDRFLVNVV